MRLIRVIHDQGPICAYLSGEKLKGEMIVIVLGKRWVDMREVKPYCTRIEDYAEFDKLLPC
jgi:hypothetical protein